MKASAGGQITIRTAQAKDAPRLAALSGQLAYTATPDEILRRLPRLARDHEHVVFVAEDCSGTVIAWTHAFVCHLLEADPQTEVSVLVVDEARRGNGVGRLLMERVEQWARQKNCWAVRVRSNVTRERAHAFYGRLGYETVKTQRVFRKTLLARGSGK